MKLLLFRTLVALTMLCFISEDLSHFVCFEGETLVELQDQKESKSEKKETEKEQDDKLAHDDFFKCSHFYTAHGLVLLGNGSFLGTTLPVYLTIFSPPPEPILS